MDIVADLLGCLKRMLDADYIGTKDRLQCIVTAFEVLKNQEGK